jgi:serine/threonine-protein kinase
VDTSTQLAAALGGRYDIEREIGAGGMATVYLARDVKHDRRVALKVLRPELGAVLGADRFLAEIRVTANLQHPNLLPLFDSGEAGGLLYYVMPFVEGETLRARLDRERQLPIGEAIRIATQVAAAMDYAHRNGIIHRDLKPENILLHDGQPVIADFGIALAVSNAGGQRVTQTGLSLGTPQYMSPEQATGDRAIDARTDIYALGAITYELLTGEPPHSGTTAQAIIAKLMTEDPRPLTLLRRSVSEPVEEAVLKALEKLPADRFATAHEFSDALNAKTSSISFKTSVRRTKSFSVPSLTQSVVTLAALIVAVWAWRTRKTDADVAPARFEITTPAGTSVDNVFAPVTISPDGKTIIFRAVNNNVVRLMRRRTGALEPVALPNTEAGGFPTVSLDNKRIAFSHNGVIAVTSIDGGPVTQVKTLGGEGLAWLDDDNLLVGGTFASTLGLAKLNVTTKQLTAFTKADSASNDLHHSWPKLLDDGKTVLFVSWAKEGISGARISKTTRDGGPFVISDVVGTCPLGTVMAVPFDLGKVKSTGAAVPLISGVSIVTTAGAARASLASNGTLVYLTGEYASRIVTVDMNGKDELLFEPQGIATKPQWSPDGKHVVLSIEAAQGHDLWMRDMTSGALSRLTTDGVSRSPIWSHDARSILYVKRHGETDKVMRQRLDAASPVEVIADVPHEQINEIAVSSKNALIMRVMPRGFMYAVDLNAATRTPTRVTSTTFTEVQPAFSPDGNWLAYVSDESSTPQIMLRAFPGPSAPVQLSARGGTEPVWSSDGKTLYYHEGKRLVAASLSLAGTPSVTSTRVLFEGPYLAPALTGAHTYDIAPDGKRFVMQKFSTEQSRLIVVTNWFEELSAKFGNR